ncbi:hypothetical protein AZE42_06086 [Rhizopogon vesiculosus]|uniref:Uncharacterized protein n=1 Tax=Rhizopogon vesiculosus TaxID=180088 RepID=A0A1J8QH73_9AGAM|nr:hypothetical protein AZE42_06086 [Rhizopogon vesiculosus]
MEEEDGWEAGFGEEGFGPLDLLVVEETINSRGAWTYGSPNRAATLCRSTLNEILEDAIMGTTHCSRLQVLSVFRAYPLGPCAIHRKIAAKPTSITPDSHESEKYIRPANTARRCHHCGRAEVSDHGRLSLHPGYHTSPACKVHHSRPYTDDECQIVEKVV